MRSTCLPHYLLLSANDGTVSVYDFKDSKRIVFKTEPNHCETIFDIKISIFEHDLMATCNKS
jgi:hypothetical protein